MDLQQAIESLGGDIETLKREYDAVTKTLGMLGLSDYESRAYIALVAMGVGTADEIATVAQIPRTSAYKVMETLEEKGYVLSSPGRPRSFRPEDPAKLGTELSRRVEDTFAKLTHLQDVLHERGVPELVYTITGKEKVLEKIGELLETSTTSFVISTPQIADIRKRHERRFQHAVDRGLKITIITEPFVKVPAHTTLVRREGLIATDVISDGRRSLIASADLAACGFVDNAALSQHLAQFLDILVQERRRGQPASGA